MLFLASCGQKTKEITTLIEYKPISDKEPFVLLSPKGDTIPTGVPIPAKGKWIDPDSVAKPETVPLTGIPKAIPAHPNLRWVKNPRIVNILEKLPIITSGKNGIPFPDTFKAMGKVVPIIQPKSVPALPFQFEDQAAYDIQYLTDEEGLNDYNVLTMLEDSRGNLWIGTSGEGVSCYNGYRFKHFNTSDGLSDGYVKSILEDRQGHLWFGTILGGVNHYDGHRFTHYTTEGGLSNNQILSILEDSWGNIWFGTNNGVSCFDGQNFINYNIEEGLCGKSVYCLLEDLQGNIWFGTEKGACRLSVNNDKNNFTHFTNVKGLNYAISCLLEDEKGNIWFGTRNHGVSCYNGHHVKQFTSEHGLSNNYILSMLEDYQGNIWFGTFGGGVNCYDGLYFTHFTTKEGLSDNVIRSILEDSQGHLWFGTRSGGINRYDPRSFTHFKVADETSPHRVNAIAEDSQGQLWFGTSSGVFSYDGQNYIQYQELNGHTINTIIEDNSDRLWLGTNQNGSYSFNGNSFTHFTVDQGLANNYVSSIMEDQHGYLWFSSFYGGASCFDGRSFTHFNIDSGLSNNTVTCIFEDSQDNLWLNNFKSVVSRFNGRNFIHYTVNEGFSDDSVFSIIEDNFGNLWFGTSGSGVNCYDGKRFNEFTTENGLYNDWVWAITEDNDNRLWFYHYGGGITLLRPDSTKSLKSSGLESSDFQFLNFGKKDGLKIFRPGGGKGNNAFLDHKNRIWWGTPSGATMLDLNKFKIEDTSPRIGIEQLVINHINVDFRRLNDPGYRQTIPFGKKLNHSFDSVSAFNNYPVNLKLPYDHYHFSIHFSAIDWSAPWKIEYSFILEGLEKTWNPAKSEPIAYYSSLPPGKFTFRVKARGEAQVWSEPFNYSFTILPPWWKTWWAYSLYGLAIFGLFYVFYWYQLNRRLVEAETHRLRELDQVKTKLYTNITHEFRTPLTIISGMTDQIKAAPQKWFHEGLEMIKRNSLRLTNLVNQMLALSKLEAGSLPVKMIQGDILDLLKYLVESFHSYAESKDIQMHFLTDLEELNMDYDEEKMLAIASNLLSNAIKFTPEGGDVYVSIDRELGNSSSQILILRVKDTGIGIPGEKLPHIFDRFYQVDDEVTRKAEGTGIGLALTRELVKLLKGEILVQSKPKKGTEFIVKLPITNNGVKIEVVDGQSIKDQVTTFVPLIIEDLEMTPTTETPVAIPIALIIEDNKDMIRYISACLADEYKITVALNGQQGIDQAIKLIPDIIISDVMMPEKDGMEVTQILKEDERTSHIPIVLLTAKADMESKLEGLERGADAYLAKPFNKEELLIRLRKLLELRQKLQQYYLSLASKEVATNQSEDISTQRKVEDVFVLKVRSIIEDHLIDYNLNVQKLSREVGVSRAQLHRKLTALTGYSANRFIRFIRLSKAKELLQNQELTIAAVAYDTGFNDPDYFIRVFRKEIGETPGQYRKRIDSSSN